MTSPRTRRGGCAFSRVFGFAHELLASRVCTSRTKPGICGGVASGLVVGGKPGAAALQTMRVLSGHVSSIIAWACP